MCTRFSLNLRVQKLHPFAVQGYQFNVFPIYLFSNLVVTHVRINHANFQRNWPIVNGAESFEIMPPTLHSNFTVQSKNPYTTKSAKGRNIYDTLEFQLWITVTYPCLLCIYIHKTGRFLPLFNENKLKWLVFSHTSYFMVIP